MAKVNTTTTSTVIVIESWGEIEQRLFYQNRQIVNASKRITPIASNCNSLLYVTKDGVDKKLYFLDDVTVAKTLSKADAGANREIGKLRDDLWKLYKKHEVASADFVKADAELEAQLKK